eukprot:889631-Amorphochlora_amoeboformis.AAC.2
MACLVPRDVKVIGSVAVPWASILAPGWCSNFRFDNDYSIFLNSVEFVRPCLKTRTVSLPSDPVRAALI